MAYILLSLFIFKLHLRPKKRSQSTTLTINIATLNDIVQLRELFIKNLLSETKLNVLYKIKDYYIKRIIFDIDWL